MKDKILFFFYQWTWQILHRLTQWKFLPWPKKIIAYQKERRWPQLVWRRRPTSDQRRIWFHAASGEIEYIKPLLRLWKEKHPTDCLFLTYFSTSARPMIKQLSEIDGWAPLPMDIPSSCEDFLRQLKPNILLISRTDLWPVMLRSYKQGPKILLASTWAEGSKKTQGWGRKITQWCLPLLEKICVVSAEDAENLQAMARSLPIPLSVAVTGDPRFDQVQFRLLQRRAAPPKIHAWAQGQFTFIAGSTWPEDEDQLISAWEKTSLPLGRFLIVPHEVTPESLEVLEGKLRSAHLSYQRWSQVAHSEAPLVAPVLIFDAKGWLAELYPLAQLAFVGGSFKRQVHSVMEALGASVPVAVGPFYKNNREAMAFSKLKNQDIAFVEVTPNSESLAACLKKHGFLAPTSAETLKKEIANSFRAHCGGTEKTYKELLSCL